MNSLDSVYARGVRRALACLAACGAGGGLLLSGLAWLWPLEVIQGWAVARVDPSDSYAMFEAVGMAEAGQWAARWFGLAMAGMCLVLWRQRSCIAPWIEGAGRGDSAAVPGLALLSPEHGGPGAAQYQRFQPHGDSLSPSGHPGPLPHSGGE